MHLRLIFIIISLLFCLQTSFAYKNKRVITIVNKEAQPDSLSYNLVDAFLGLVYEKLKEGKIELWDSPRKNNRINFLSIQSIEKSSNTLFSQSENFFTYEIWSSNRKETSFDIIGFSFSSLDSNNNEVIYGYLDYLDISDYLKSNYIDATINGYYQNSFFHVFMNKAYHFDLFYFDNKPIQKINSRNPTKDYQKGLKIKNKAFTPKSKNKNRIPVKKSKLIEYVIKATDYDAEAEYLINALETFFDTNRSTLYSYGGQDIINNFNGSAFILTKIKVIELWTYTHMGLEQNIKEIQLYSFGLPFEKIIYPRDIKLLNIKIGEVSLIQLLEFKDFKYHILKINEHEVDQGLSPRYIKALKNNQWNSLSEIGKTTE